MLINGMKHSVIHSANFRLITDCVSVEEVHKNLGHIVTTALRWTYASSMNIFILFSSLSVRFAKICRFYYSVWIRTACGEK